MPAAILLIAHGSRRPDANADLVKVAAALQDRLPDHIVEIAYLELVDPEIPAGLQHCLNRGADSICMLPYFLSAGAHVTDDLREFQQTFQREHPQVSCQLCPPLGLHPLIVDVLLARLSEVKRPL